jgi:putative acetyltransferase
MAGTVIIRAETSSDAAAIHAVEAAAFGREGEAMRVDALRELQDGFVSFVAADDEHVVGHICFSRVGIDGCEGLFLVLGPMAFEVPDEAFRVIEMRARAQPL